MQLPNLTASLDGYYIDFSNLIGRRTFSIYASGSLNSAKDHATHLWIANAPDYTASLGPIYSTYGFYASLIGQWIGDRYGDVGQIQRLKPFIEMDGAASYDLMHIDDQLKDLTLTVQIMNFTNVTKIINLAGCTVQTVQTLWRH